MNRQTQNQRLVKHLRQHRFITRATAAYKLGIMNLWARVAEIEREPYGCRIDRRKQVRANARPVLQYWLCR